MKNLNFAARYLAKARGNNLTRLVSLTLGLGVGLLVFSYVNFLASFDRFYPDSDRIYQLWTSYDCEGMKGNASQIYAPVAPAMQQEMPQVEAATRLIGTFRYNFFYENVPTKLNFLAVDTMFFDVLDFGVVSGNPREIFAVAENIMLSESAARRIFGTTDPVGKTLIDKDGRPHTVGGVFRDPPVNNALGKFDSLCSIEYLNGIYYMGWDGGDSFSTYLKLTEGSRPEEIEAQIYDFFDRHGISADDLAQWGQRYFLQPIAKSNTTSGKLQLIIYILVALGSLTLFVAAMNYILVSISTLVSRSKTIAMLRIGGARKADVFRIFLCETAIIIAVALVIDVFVLWALQNEILALTQYSVADLFAFDRIYAPLSVILAVFLLAGVIPAVIFTSVPLSAAFKGAVDARRRWKQALLFVQIVCITFVLSFLSVVTLQFNRTVDGDLGYDHDRLLYAMFYGNTMIFDNIENELAAMPCVEAAGTSFTLPCYGLSGMPCVDEQTGEILFSARELSCDGNFFTTLNIPIVAGNNFTIASSGNEVLVNTDYLRRRGWTPQEAVGRTICNVPNDPGLYTIIGVVDDYCTGVSSEIKPIVFHNFRRGEDPQKSEQYIGGTNTFVRLTEMTPENIAAVQEKIEEWWSVDNHLLVVYDDTFNGVMQEQRSFRDVSAVVALIILAIAAIGLIGYVGDEIERRRKEIAIRKVNGATSRGVMLMMMRRMALLSLPAVVVGTAAAYYVAELWIRTYENRIALRWWIFATAAVVVILIVYTVQIVRTWRIANANPVTMIKTE